MDPLLEGLTTEQHDAVTTVASPLCVVAGAGSGKTRVLTRRIAWQAQQGNLDPRRVLAVTFTRRAGRELRSRLRRLGLTDVVRAGTFHAVALAQLRRFAADSGRRAPRILESRAALVSELCPKFKRADVVEVVNEIGWCRARLVTPEQYASTRRRAPVGRQGRFAQIFADYESAKSKRRVLDFDDVLVRARGLMTAETSHAAAQRWLHQHLLVDEFQDINPLQFALLKSWLGPASTLLVVGDPDQAIYGWNGADPELLNNVTQHLPGAAVLRMRTNFRSSPEILAAAGKVLGRDAQPSVRPPGDEPTVTVCDGADEAASLAQAVRNCHRPGGSWGRQAVLARTNAQLEPLRRALVRAGIPVAVADSQNLAKRDAFKDWPREARLADWLADTHPGDELLALVEDHLILEPDATIGAFVATLRAEGPGGRSPSSAGVAMMTFHAAKGLEWPVVHLVGLEEGFVPIAHARTQATLGEERRLLHVAVTRAQQELHVMWCNRRKRDGDAGEAAERNPSRWLEAIAASKPTDPDTQLARNRAGLATSRQALRSAEEKQSP